MLDQIVDGRTDLVFEFIAAGNPATATDAGVIHGDERDIIDRVFRLGGRRVGSIMTPRMNLVVLNTTDSPAQIQEKITGSGFSLYPL